MLGYIPSLLWQTLYLKANQTFYLDILKPLKHDATELDTESIYGSGYFYPLGWYWSNIGHVLHDDIDSKELYQMLIEKQESASGEAVDLLLSTAYNNVTAQICAHRDLWLNN